MHLNSRAFFFNDIFAKTFYTFFVFRLSRNENTVKLVYNDHPWYPKKWPLLTGGRCSQVNYIGKIQNWASKWWLLQTGGRYSKVLVSSGLTVLHLDFCFLFSRLCSNLLTTLWLSNTTFLIWLTTWKQKLN